MAGDVLDHPIETPAGEVPIIPVSLMAAGAYLVWFGVRYWGSDTRWPTDPLKSLLQGNGIPVPDRSGRTDAILSVQQSAAALYAGGQAAAAGAAAAAGGAAAGTTPAGTLNHAQLEALWTRNGGNPATANVAAATAQAESSGRTAITSPNPDGGINVGLWQLDTKGEGAGYTVAQLQDPDTNARITILKTNNGINWGPWASHPTAYKQYLEAT